VDGAPFDLADGAVRIGPLRFDAVGGPDDTVAAVGCVIRRIGEQERLHAVRLCMTAVDPARALAGVVLEAALVDGQPADRAAASAIALALAGAEAGSGATGWTDRIVFGFDETTELDRLVRELAQSLLTSEVEDAGDEDLVRAPSEPTSPFSSPESIGIPVGSTDVDAAARETPDHAMQAVRSADLVSESMGIGEPEPETGRPAIAPQPDVAVARLDLAGLQTRRTNASTHASTTARPPSVGSPASVDSHGLPGTDERASSTVEPLAVSGTTVTRQTSSGPMRSDASSHAIASSWAAAPDTTPSIVGGTSIRSQSTAPPDLRPATRFDRSEPAPVSAERASHAASTTEFAPVHFIADALGALLQDECDLRGLAR
jgi:hypothetical protein